MENEIESLKARIKTLEKAHQGAFEEGRALGLEEAAELLEKESVVSLQISADSVSPGNKVRWREISKIEKNHAEYLRRLASGEVLSDEEDNDNCDCTVGDDWCKACRAGHPR